MGNFLGQYSQQSLLDNSGSNSGFGQSHLPAPGKVTMSSRIAPRASTPEGEVEHHLYYGNAAYNRVKYDLVPQAQRLISDRGPIRQARDVFSRLEGSFTSLTKAVDEVNKLLDKMEADTHLELRERADMLTLSYQAIKPDVESVLARKPPEMASVLGDEAFSLHLDPPDDPDDGGTQMWTDSLDQMDVQERAAMSPKPIGWDQEECSAEGPAAPDAVEGIHLFPVIKRELDAKWGSLVSSDLVGPGQAGPYKISASLREGKVTFYLAFHRERQYPEWVIGPGAVGEFVDNIDVYVGAARTNLPGSPRIPNSMKDGADKRPDDPSMLKQEALGKAPWQKDSGLPEMNQLWAPPDQEEGRGIFGVMWDGLQQGLDDANGGSSAVSAWNTHIRLSEYVQPAQQMRDAMLADVKAGKIPHMHARREAVSGRNKLMRKTREKLSPAGRYASQQTKSDRGVTEKQMVGRKVPDILRHAEDGGRGMEVLGEDGDAAKLAKFLGEESPEWARYQEALMDGESRAKVTARATQEMAEMPSVSRSIINSAGKSNKWVTRVARVGRVASAAGAVLGIVDAVETIYDAEEGQRLHVAAQEGGGFVGGIVGAELGSMAAVWLASALISGPGAPVILIVSLIGGMIGAGIGAEVGREVVDAVPEAIGQGINAVVTPGSAQAGGYTGLYERSARDGMNQKNILERARQMMTGVDEEVGKVDQKIGKVKDRDKLDDLHAQRFRLLSWRDHVGKVYSLLRTGQISDVEAWKALGGEVVESEPQVSNGSDDQ